MMPKICVVSNCEESFGIAGYDGTSGSYEVPPGWTKYGEGDAATYYCLRHGPYGGLENFKTESVPCSQPGCMWFADINSLDGLLSLPSGWVHQWAPGGKCEYFCPDHRPLRPRTDRIMNELFETNPILNVIDELRETLKAKQHDYAGADPFNNFTESAATADITPRQAALTLLGVKLSRIRNLERQNNEAANEPLLDSYLDLAGYAIILYAMAKETQ